MPDVRGDLMPEIDVKENGKQMVLTAELPGMEEKDIDLSVRDGVLTLKGEKKMEKSEEKDDYRVMERRYGSFQRSFSLPESVKEDGIKANFDKGVLTITMPKKAEAKKSEKKIKIG
jgi:HSP20 family protein